VLFKKESTASTIYGKSVNHFPKFIKHFWSNGNHFSVDHYFRPLPNTGKYRNHFSEIILRRNKRGISVKLPLIPKALKIFLSQN